MAGTATIDQLMSMRGVDVYSTDGDKLGSIEEIYVDEQTNTPEWLGLGAGLLGSKRVLVPVKGVNIREDSITVPYSKDQVKDTPDIDTDDVSQETEAQLYAHYGLDYSERRSETGLPEGAPATGAGRRRGTADEGEVVRTEEELRVGKRETEAGRARLRKWVETEPVEEDVQLRQEKARVTREPIDQPVSGAEIGEQEVEVPLRGEEAVVQKETVAKERIGLEKDVETERERVGDEVRKERVEVEGDVEKKRKRK
jgi:stress response protein YsnF